jgi:pimeloyl-ACP methyl ester carboxylesterase
MRKPVYSPDSRRDHFDGAGLRSAGEHMGNRRPETGACVEWPGSSVTAWGWNAKFASQVTVPTLIIRGDLDTQVPLSDIQDLLDDLVAVPQKVFVHVACASHYLMWENQHMSLLNASVEWLLHGTFAGEFNGSFAVDTSGQVHQDR